jgi:hypothetical protein
MKGKGTAYQVQYIASKIYKYTNKFKELPSNKALEKKLGKAREQYLALVGRPNIDKYWTIWAELTKP